MSEEVNRFFSPEEEQFIVQAIQYAERATSGEIRVHIEQSSQGNVIKRAKAVFDELNMEKTKARNGVLFYLAVNDKQFAIYGDEGINQVVPANFWEQTKDKVLAGFQSNAYAMGLIYGILEAGEQLKHYFPYASDDINELSDEISKG